MKSLPAIILLCAFFGIALLTFWDGPTGNPEPTMDQVARLEALKDVRTNKAIARALRESHEHFKPIENEQIARLRRIIQNSDSPGERALALEDLRKIENRWAEREAEIERVESGAE